MGIKQYRVDGRMLHGQVCTTYGRLYGVDEYIVVNEAISNDELQISLLELASLHAGVHVLSPKDAYDFITNEKFEGTTTMVVFKEIDDAVELIVDLGLKVDAVQIGGMYSKSGRQRKKYDVSLFADDLDAACFRKLADAGVDLTFQVVPDYKEKQLAKMINY